MKKFKEDSLIKKLMLTLLLVIFLGTTILPNISYAGLPAAIGGALIEPVCDLILAIGDGFMSLIQKSIFGMSGEISVDLTGKTPWYVWLGRFFNSCCCNCSRNCSYRRNSISNRGNEMGNSKIIIHKIDNWNCSS